VEVNRYKEESFLMIFQDKHEVDRVLHSPQPVVDLFLVLAQQIVGSSCLIFDASPSS
jgi:hypothetical protein